MIGDSILPPRLKQHHRAKGRSYREEDARLTPLPSCLDLCLPQVDAKERANKVCQQGARGRVGGGALDDEAESAGNNASGRLSEPYKVLGDAGTILRDPSTMHLLLATALKV